MMNESDIGGRATSEMRRKAKRLNRESDRLKREAADWLILANALDEIEKSAIRINGETDGPMPYIGAGSTAESLLRRLAST